MGFTRYQKLMKIIEGLGLKKGSVISEEALKFEIIKNCGSEKRALTGYLMLLKNLNIFDETKNGLKVR